MATFQGLQPRDKPGTFCMLLLRVLLSLFLCTCSTALLLSEDNLKPLLHFVERAAERWREIGAALKFSKESLDAIQTSTSTRGPVACLTKLLTRWLKRAPPKYSLPTLETLLEALRDEAIEEYRIAYDMELEFTSKAHMWSVCSALVNHSILIFVRKLSG